MADISQIVLKDSSGNVIGTYNVKDATVPHTSEAAASGGTTLSLVTTGEKATWNAKSDLQLGTTSTTALRGDTKYAGASTAGGAATSANKWATPRTLTVGNTTKSVDGSTNVSWPNPLKFAGYGSDSANTSGWYKVMTVSQSGYSDTNLNLLITSGYSKNASGILHVHVRCDSSTANQLQTLAWLTRIGWSAGDVYYKDHGNNTWSLYVYQANTQYGRVQVHILSEVGTTTNQQNITLSNNSTKESSAPSGGTAAWDGATVNNANYLGGVITASYLNCLQKYTGGNASEWAVYVDQLNWSCGIIIANINNWGNGAWFVNGTSSVNPDIYPVDSRGLAAPFVAIGLGSPARYNFRCSSGVTFRRCTWLGLY